MTEQILLVLGLVLIVSGLAAYVNPPLFRRTLGSFYHNPGLIFFVGVVNLGVGLFLVINHNVWSSLGQIIVSIVAWAAVIRGFIMIVLPKTFLAVFKYVWLGKGHLVGEAVSVIIIGLVLLYIAL